MQQVEEAKKSPTTKYDSLIYKQNCVNDTVSKQVCPYFFLSLLFIADKPFLTFIAIFFFLLFHALFTKNIDFPFFFYIATVYQRHGS